ncbi:hypothetical protein ACFSUK_27970 [Sphingobium scionense]
MQLLYVGIAMRVDVGLRGAVHPAYRWGLAVIAGRLLLVELLGRTTIVVGAAAALAAG